MNKTKLKQQLQKIQTMSTHQLDEYANKVSLSLVDDKAKKFLFKAIDIRRREVTSTVKLTDCLAVSSVISEVA